MTDQPTSHQLTPLDDDRAWIRRWGIGLTGGIATGKSTVANILMQLGFGVIDADQLSREVMLPGHECFLKIMQTFGSHLILRDGTLDRQSLGKLVFADKDKRLTLENIVHPAIHAQLLQKLNALGWRKQEKPWFYEAALLLESGRAQAFREVWLCLCSPAIQRQRLAQRDRLTDQEIDQRLAAQWTQERKLSLCQVAIDTDRPMSQLQAHLESLISQRLQ